MVCGTVKRLGEYRISEQTLRTPFCDKFGIQYPIVQAPMGGIARADLAAAVSNAGGLGTLAAIRMSQENLRSQIRTLRTLTNRPFNVNMVLSVFDPAQLQVCLEEKVPVISFFWGDPSPYVDQAHKLGIKVIHQVGSVKEAAASTNAGVDAIVAQGFDAGGHVRGTTGTLALVPQIVDKVDPVPVLAAGGIADGRGLAAALVLGAQGVWVGTRFAASVESEAHTEYKKRLVEASPDDCVYTDVFDVGWPPDSPARVLRNKLIDQFGKSNFIIVRGSHHSGHDTELIAQIKDGPDTLDVIKYGAPAPTRNTVGKIHLLPHYAGQGVGLLDTVKPAGDIVREMVSEAKEILAESRRFFA